jgi:uncharacterized repeat protein (TIGR03803 family)
VVVDVDNADGTLNTSADSDVTLSIYYESSDGTLGGTTTVAADDGVATFNGLSLTTPGTYRLEATDGTDYAAASTDFTITPAASAKLAFAQEPTATGVGAAVTPAVTVKVEDAFGNLVTDDDSEVTLSLASGPTGGAIGGSLTANVVDGVATFTNLWLSKAGSYSLLATDGSLTSATSSTFAVSGSYSLTQLANFNGTNGANSYAPPVLDSSGDLFGTTLEGGTDGYGTVWEIVHGSSTITTLASFDGTDGEFPYAGLMIDGSGNLYGTTAAGGADGDGSVFEVAHGSSTITTIASFTGTNGKVPKGSLVMDSSGNLFGTTVNGGADGDGAVFEIAHGGSTITDLASFTGTNGENPQAGLVMDSSGNLYGTALLGGSSNDGVVFEVADGSSSITALASFDGTNGFYPWTQLVIDSSGNLYGTTEGGNGTVFEWVKGSSSITTLATFPNRNTNPGPLIIDGSGDLFGATQPSLDAGTSQGGTIFEIVDGSDTITTLASLDGANGAWAQGLVMDSSGDIFGVTNLGGTNSFNVGGSDQNLGFGGVIELQS